VPENHSRVFAPGRCVFLQSVLGLILALLVLKAAPLHAAQPLRQVQAVMHAHTTWSSGNLSMDELVSRARATGVEAVFLSENHLLRFEYGLPPLRHLLRYRVEYPSLLARGTEAFLAAVKVANARQQDVLLVPGTEIIPHYYWTGSLFAGNLVMHDAQKNILAFGLYRPEDYRELPVVGNPGAGRWSLASMWLMSPVLLGVPGIWLFRLRRQRSVRLKYFQVVEEKGYTGYGILCLALGVILLANNFPFRVPPTSPYDSNAGVRPDQAVIDFVNSRGGVVVWSMPEARDHHVISVAGFQATIQTDPYPDDLLRTDRFLGFGGVYEDTTHFTDPGGEWDHLLTTYIHGQRASPAWAIGEAAFHREGEAGIRFGDVRTVLLSPDRAGPSLLVAMRAGRMYALQRTPEVGLVLDRFQVALPGRLPAESGSMLSLKAGDQPEIQVSVQTSPEKRMPIQIRLIRAGIAVQSLRGETPFVLRWKETPLSSGTRLYYRLDVHGPAGHQILSNPIFVRTVSETGS
jgi:hypothetical protein